ncbi:MAG: DUF2905 domain-containing protein [Methyloceanibacter sp.]
MKPLGASFVFFLAVVALMFLSLRYGLGRLPGDLIIDRGGVVVYLPITTAVIVSVILSAVVWLFRR